MIPRKNLRICVCHCSAAEAEQRCEVYEGIRRGEVASDQAVPWSTGLRRKYQKVVGLRT